MLTNAADVMEADRIVCLLKENGSRADYQPIHGCLCDS